MKRRPGRTVGLLSAALFLLVWVVTPAALEASGGGHSPRPSRPSGGIGIGIRIRLNWPPKPKEPEKPKEDPFESGFFADKPAKPRARVAAPSRPGHPETDGSLVSRAYFLENDLGFGRDFAGKLWSDPGRTLNGLQKTFQKARRAKDTKGQRNSLTDIGHANYLLGRFDQAEKNYRNSLKLDRERGDLEGEAFNVNNIGAAYAASGNYEMAQWNYDDALSKFRKADNASGEGMALNNMAIMARNRGRFGKAVDYFEAALKASEAADRSRVLKLTNLGKTYESWGEYKRAVDTYNEALDIVRKIGDVPGEQDLLILLGETYQAWGRKTSALASLEKSLELHKKTRTRPYRVSNLVGALYLDMGEIQRAKKYIKQGKYKSGLGRLSLMAPNYKKARKHYEDLRKSAVKYNRSRDLYAAYTGLGMTYEALGNLSKAEQYFSKGMEVSEEIRESLLLSERKNFYSKPINGFLPSTAAKGLIGVRIKRKQGDKSIYPSETTRARMFADTIARRADVNNPNVPKEVTLKEEKIFNSLASLRKARSLLPREKDRRRFDAISQELRKAEKALKAFVGMLWAKFEDYASVRSPRPVKLKGAALRPEEYVIILDVLSKGVGVKLLKGKKVVLSSYEQVDAGKLNRDVKDFRRSFERARLRDFDDELGKRLYRKLLSAALAKVPKGTPVTIIPDGVLALLPFEALVVEGTARWRQGDWGPYPEGLTYVGDLYPVGYYRSITAVTLARKHGKGKATGDRLLVMADPIFGSDDERAEGLVKKSNPHSETSLLGELELIRDETGVTFPRLPLTAQLGEFLKKLDGEKTDLYTGAQARKPLLFKEPLTRYGSMVFATHGYAGNDLPGIQEPILALTLVGQPRGSDGFLRMSEVMDLTMNADLVALTACQTGFGRHLAGEGIMSLGRAFQCAGAKTVVMSLWSVAEDSSVRLVESFFKHMKNGNGKLEALRLARADVRKQGYDHPFFWAPFILVGEVN